MNIDENPQELQNVISLLEGFYSKDYKNQSRLDNAVAFLNQIPKDTQCQTNQ